MEKENNNAEKQQEVKNETAQQQAQEQPKQQEQQEFEKVEEKTNSNNEPGFFEKAYGVTAEFCKEHKGVIAAVGGGVIAIASGIVGFFCGKSCSNKD